MKTLNRFWLTALLLLTAVTTGLAGETPLDAFDEASTVGRNGASRVVLPVNQVITPAGRQVELHGLRPQVLALSPDGKRLVTSGKTHSLKVIDPATGQVIQTVELPDDGPLANTPAPTSTHYLKPDRDEQVSFTGLAFSPDGSRLYLSNVKGSIKVFSVDSQAGIKGLGAIALPNADAPERKEEIPAGLAVSADGQRLYVVGNLSNRLLEFELPSGKFLRSFDVGAVPYGIALTGHKAYVSNWGGRRPDATSVVGTAGLGTFVRVDAKSVAAEGSVSVVDLAAGKVTGEILTDRHASALQLTPDGRYLCVANAGSDTITVIATDKDRVVETIPVRWQPQDLFGAAPNALAMDAKGKTLYVCNGTQNAVAIYKFRPGKSQLLGLLPTGWYPGAIVFDGTRQQLAVASIKGTLPDASYDPGRNGYNSHEHLGTISLIPLPKSSELKAGTQAVLRNYRQAVEAAVFAPARPGQAPVPVPERIGEPSVFKHVVYLVKENRTYDQVLGDVTAGRGDASLCTFGEQVTPNQHKFVRDFTLLDNIYCCSILSADGHQWATTAMATDYMEKLFCDFPRSYPDMQDKGDLDAMAYSPCGFIWDDALAHGKSVRDYGECSVAVSNWKDAGQKKRPEFLDYYHDFVNQTGLIVYSNYPCVDVLHTNMMIDTVGWDLAIPDVYRAAQFIRELKQFEAQGSLPNLIIICLPNDHTSGTDPGRPTPAAQVADNDLAFGQIVDALSHSPFWKDTCVFGIEDDPQAGWDHISGYRTTGYVVSAYNRRRTVVSVNYNQNSILRTIELMLGLPPMNQMDATAVPMAACFTNVADLTPYDCVTNNIPLDQMNPQLSTILDHRQLRDAVTSSHFKLEKPDQCPEDALNRILWHSQMGFEKKYPQWAITATDND